MIKTDVIVSYSTLTQKTGIDPEVPEIYTDIILNEGHSIPDTRDKFVISSYVPLRDSEISEKLTCEIIANPIPVLNPEVSLVLPDKKLKDPGFETEGVMVFPFPENTDPVTISEFKSELMRNPGIINVSGSSNPLFHELDKVLVHADKTDLQVRMLSVDFSFIELMQMELVMGRTFSPDFPSDNQHILVNERVIINSGSEPSVGDTITLYTYEEQGIVLKEFAIIGIVKDFYFPSNSSLDKPLIITLCDNTPDYLFIKVSQDNLEITLDNIEEQWKQSLPDYPFRPMNLLEYLGI